MRTEPTPDRLRELQALPYAAYLLTPEWRRRRDRALARACWRCEWPDCEARHGLEVHHKIYEHLGCELDGELLVTCAKHHTELHRRHLPPHRMSARLVVMRDMLWRQGWQSVSEFVEALKQAVTTYKLVSDADYPQFREEMNRLVRDLRVEEPINAPPPEAWLPDPLPLTHNESTATLAMISERLQVDVGPQRIMRDALWCDVAEVEQEEEQARARALEMGIDLSDSNNSPAPA